MNVLLDRVNNESDTVFGELHRLVDATTTDAMPPVAIAWAAFGELVAAAYGAGYTLGQVVGAFLFGGEGGITPTG